MTKVTKIGNTNCNPELKCELCGALIPLGLPHYSVIFSVIHNPSKNYRACKECAEKYRNLELQQSK